MRAAQDAQAGQLCYFAHSLADLVAQIVEATLSALEKTEPELASDIYDQGIVMTGCEVSVNP